MSWWTVLNSIDWLSPVCYTSSRFGEKDLAEEIVLDGAVLGRMDFGGSMNHLLVGVV